MATAGTEPPVTHHPTTDTETPNSRGWKLALLLSGIIAAAPLFVVRHLPFTDLPEHVAASATLAHWFDPAWRIAEHYQVAVGTSQYLMFHAVAALLTRVVGDAELANVLLLAAAAIAMPWTLSALLRAFGRDPRLGIFAAPLFWNRTVQLGFAPYVASIPVLFASLALATRQVEVPTCRRGWALAAIAIAIFYLHVTCFVTFAATCAGLVLWNARSSGSARSWISDVVRRVGWILPSGIVAMGWSVFGRVTYGNATLEDEGSYGRIGFMRSVHAFGLWAHDVWRGHADDLCGAAFWLFFLIVLVLGTEPRKGRDRLYPLIPLFCVLALYFVTPFRVGAAAMLNVRMAPIVAAFAILGLPIRAGRVGRFAIAGVFLVTVATSSVSAREIMRIDREELGDITPLLSRMRTGSRLVSLNFHLHSPRTYYPPYVHVGSLHRAIGGGVAAYSFTELPHWSIHYRPEAAPRTPVPFLEFNPCLFRNVLDGNYFDYALVRGAFNPFRARLPGPTWRAIGSLHDFVLYERVVGADNTDPTVLDYGPCAPDEQQATEHVAY